MSILQTFLHIDTSKYKQGLDDARERSKAFMYSISKFGGVGSGPAALLGMTGPAAAAAEIGALAGVS